MTALVHDPQRIGQLLAASGFFTDAKDAAQAAVKVMAGAELGFPPVQSMMGVYIVKGKVTLSANLMAAAIKRHPNYTFRVKEHTNDRCVIDFLEQGEVIGTSEFTMDDARQAGLAGSQTWRSFPKNMLYARALSNGAKWYCPDVFGGPIYTPDELGAEVDGESGEMVGAPVPAIPPALSDVPSDLPWEPPAEPVQPVLEAASTEPDGMTDEFMPAPDLMAEIARQGGMKAAEFRALLESVGVEPPQDLASREKRLGFLGLLSREKRVAIGQALAHRAETQKATA